MEWARNGAGTRPDVLHSMPEGFRSVNEGFRNILQGGNPRKADFGHRFDVLHDFASKSMQEAVGGQSEMVRRQESEI